MLRVTIANNVKRTPTPVLVNEDDTLRECLEANGFDYARGLIHIDSAPIQPGDLNKTFRQLGYDGSEGNDRLFVAMITKADNA